MEESKNTTVAISPDVNKRLDIFCTQKGITKKDYLSLSLDYFQRYGINPKNQESPAIEIEKIHKRINDLIRFFKAQERDVINPTFEAIVTSETRINSQLGTIAKNEHLKKLKDVLENIYRKDGEQLAEILKLQEKRQSAINEKLQIFEQKNNNINEGLNKIANGILLISKALEENKDRKGLTDQIRRLFS